MPHQVELEQDLFEPKLIDLVDNDEQHFIVAFFERLKAFGMLAVQDFVELDIV
jgi:hypothetical protein